MSRAIEVVQTVSLIQEVHVADLRPPIRGTALLLSLHGSTLLAEKSQILRCWFEHFRSVLDHRSTISDAAIDRLPQVKITVDLDLPPSPPETIRAVQQLSSGKAPSPNAILAEIYKYGGHRLMGQFTMLFQVWGCGQVPQDFKDAVTVHLCKLKGNRRLCNMHRGTSLLNFAGKFFVRLSPQSSQRPL
nr:unnamed protein product [Spirometra erinaceieuropaei]